MSELAKLVEAARRGERDAMAKLHDDFAPMVHAIALARVSPSEAQDVVQDTFVQAITRLATLRDPDAFGGWLATIARNRAMSGLRQRRRVVTPLDEQRHGVGASATASAPQALQARRALEAIHSLPAAYHETLIMRLVEGMSSDEIAERTGLTPKSVRVNVHRGLRMLREVLQS
ncbi:MAG: sigma-70 family RNA polymerase sigma factor [Myxococcales bacterium]|nr:sigma-70 family RNA polymerase sigma factor [Myxococcales bacterium]